MTATWRKEFTVRYFEADQDGLVRPVVLLNYLQDVAAEHAARLGVGIAELQRRGLLWVLSRLHLAMDDYVGAGALVRVETWPVSCAGLFTVRDFLLTAEDGRRLGVATTSWAAIDLQRRRPVPVTERLPDFPRDPRRALDDPFTSLPELARVEYELALPVLRGDLDCNRHVNNTVYAGWGLEALPAALAADCRPVGIEIGFRAEVGAGERIVSQCGEPVVSGEESLWLHRIAHADGRELARLRTRWRRWR